MAQGCCVLEIRGTAGGFLVGSAPTASPKDLRQKRSAITMPPSCVYVGFLLAALQPATAPTFGVLIPPGTSLPMWVSPCLSSLPKPFIPCQHQHQCQRHRPMPVSPMGASGQCGTELWLQARVQAAAKLRSATPKLLWQVATL